MKHETHTPHRTFRIPDDLYTAAQAQEMPPALDGIEDEDGDPV